MTAPQIDLPPLPDTLLARGGDPDLLRDELLHLIVERIEAHPRSLQTAVGPSDLGTPCTRRLAYKLLDVPVTNPRRGSWKPTVGTAVHTWLEDALRAFNDAHTFDRFYLEERVYVGDVGGQPVTGRCDVYDRVTCTTVDWKVVGADALKKYKKNGPGDSYRKQAHLYGRGFANAGLPVDRVAILFLAQNDELRTAHWWSEPYDERIALDTLTRADSVAALTAKVGASALPILPTADAWCSYCPWFLPASTDISSCCPGHAAAAPPLAPPTTSDSAGDVPADPAAPAA